MKRNHFLYGCLLLGVCSCGKNEAQHKLDKVDARKAATETINDNPTDIMGFYSFIEAPNNGAFGLTQFAEYTNPFPPPTRIQHDETNDNVEFSGAFYDANRNIIPGGRVKFGRFEFLPNPGKGNLYSMSSYNVVDSSFTL